MSFKKSEYTIASAKLHAGPGGWYCICCNPYRCSPRNMKMKARRVVRRVNKQRIKIELKDIEE